MSIRALWPSADAAVDSLVDWYPRADRPALRVNFVSSLDGAVTVDGFSAGLSGAGDKLIFGALRMVCDALIVAAGTIRAERYDALRLDAARRDWRRGSAAARTPRRGRPPARPR